MEEDSVVALPRPGAGVTDDPLLVVLRVGARRMLMQAIEAEVETFLAAHAGLRDEQGRQRLVRNGHAPERQIQTGIGPLEMRRPKVRDRSAEGGELTRHYLGDFLRGVERQQLRPARTHVVLATELQRDEPAVPERLRIAGIRLDHLFD